MKLRIWSFTRIFPRLCALSLFAAVLFAQQIPVQEHTLANGFKLLMVPRKGSPNVAAGWIARVGSVNERPGITGISHLFEHMMFKGTRVIGTRNIEEDLKLQQELDRVKAELRQEEQDLARRARLGEVKDARDPAARTARHQKLLAAIEALNKRQKELIVKDEFDRIYTSNGASGMNAGTSEDFTVYFINVPANKLELWFWMESDRLLNPVFREFYSERDVVHEERRLRVDSTPTGRQLEQFDAMFWKSSPYSWPVIGWPSDLYAITREEANAYYGINYAPNNLVGALVGDFEPRKAAELAEKYFGRLRRSQIPPEPVRTEEIGQLGEQRMTAHADTNPEVHVRYHTVADGHADEPAMMVLSALLNDRTGRLYRSLVLEQQVANAAASIHEGRKYEGFFELRGVAKPGRTPEEVEQALYKEIARLQKEPVPERELEKVKNQIAAGEFRRLQSDFALMLQLLIAENNRGWRSLNNDTKKMLAVTPADLERVARQYFDPARRNVLVLYTRKAEAPAKAPPAKAAGAGGQAPGGQAQ
ncbi:MAG: insulinase family protein [Acidobacteria bacterium]|nr:insulinase family protein [Acidobacteriota bacterium]